MHGARNGGEKAKNGTASNRDNLPAGGFNLAPAVLGRIETRRLSAALFLNNTARLCGTEIPLGLALKPVGDYVRCRSGPAKFVLAITVGIACLGDTSFHWHKTNQNAP